MVDRDPRDILPPECWLLVFDKVEHAQDWLNLYRTSSYFQEVVGGKRTTGLFPQVFPHVVRYMGKRNNHDQLWLGLRLVCRPWKAVVNKMLENSEEDVLHLRRQLEDAYNFRNSARIFSFLVKFASHSGNPFVGRLASFKFDYSQSSSEDIEEYDLLTTQLLTRFGAHLKEIRVGISRTSFSKCVIRLLDCLQHVPNLDSLSVHVFGCFQNEDHDGGEVELIQYIETWRRRTLSSPLLLNLKSLSFTGVSDRGVRLHLQNAVIRLACNPNALKSVKTLGFPSELEAARVPRLDSAVVTLDAVEDCYHSNLPSPPWSSLTKLTVCHYFDDNLRPIFDCIEHFKGTLTSLRLSRPILTNHPCGLTLDLPRLRQLTIQGCNRMSLEFFTKLSNLEVLFIHHNPDPDVRLNAWDELHGFINRVQVDVDRWRLWSRAPKLAKIWLIGAAERRGGNRALGTRHVATRTNREFQRKANQRS